MASQKGDVMTVLQTFDKCNNLLKPNIMELNAEDAEIYFIAGYYLVKFIELYQDDYNRYVRQLSLRQPNKKPINKLNIREMYLQAIQCFQNVITILEYYLFNSKQSQALIISSYQFIMQIQIEIGVQKKLQENTVEKLIDYLTINQIKIKSYFDSEQLLNLVDQINMEMCQIITQL